MSVDAGGDVSIVIPTKDGGPRLREVLSRVRAQRTGRRVELIAFDSGSGDGTPDTLREFGARVTTIPAAEFNHGLTRNRAIAAGSGAYVVLLTQDALPADESWLEALLRPLQEDPEVAGVYCRQVPRPEADALTRRNLDRWVTGSRKRRVQRMPDRAEYLRLPPMERYRLCCFDDVCSAIRREVWERVPYDWAYFAEDLDWGKKVLEGGWKIVYEPEAAVIHSHDRSIWYEYKRTYVCHRRLYELFGLRTVPGPGAALRNAIRGGWADAAYGWREETGLRRKISLACKAPALALLSNLAQWRGAADESRNRPVPGLRGV